MNKDDEKLEYDTLRKMIIDRQIKNEKTYNKFTDRLKVLNDLHLLYVFNITAKEYYKYKVMGNL